MRRTTLQHPLCARWRTEDQRSLPSRPQVRLGGWKVGELKLPSGDVLMLGMSKTQRARKDCARALGSPLMLPTSTSFTANLPLFDGKAALDLLGCGMAIAATRPTCKATSSDLAVFKGHAE